MDNWTEARRKELMSLYAELPREEKAACRLLAAALGPAELPELRRMAGGMGELEAFSQLDFDRFQLESLLEKLLNRELAEKFERGRGAALWRCSPAISELVVRECLAEGLFEPLCRCVERAVKLPDLREEAGERFRVYPELFHWFYFMRKYFYLGDGEGVRALGGVKFLDSPNLRAFGHPLMNESPASLFLANPLDLDLLRNYPSEGRGRFLNSLWNQPLSPEARQELLNMRKELCLRSPSGDDAARFVWELCQLGRFQEARKYAAALDGEERELFCAVEALTSGHLPESRAHYEEAMKLCGQRQGLKTALPRSEWAPFYIPLLAALGETPAKVARAAAEAAGGAYLSEVYTMMKVLAKGNWPASESRFMEGTIAGLFDFYLFQGKGRPSIAKSWDEFASPKRMTPPVFSPPLVFFILMEAWWAVPKAAERWAPFYDTVAQELTARGMSFFAGELAAIGDALAGRERSSCEWHPLKDLIQTEKNWESSLSALEALTSDRPEAALKKGGKRILWLVDWIGSEPGEALRVKVTPLEQTFQASGSWSKGRNVAVKRLAGGNEKLLFLPMKERRIGEAIVEYEEWGHAVFEMDSLKALDILAGSPNLVRASDLAPLEVARGEPQLQVKPVERGCLIKLTPENENAAPLLVTQEGPLRLRLTSFSPMHLNMLAILGAGGLTVPDSAKERTLKVLSGLASVVTVQSELEGAEAEIPVKESDGRLRAQLTPLGEGLSVEFVLRPLGDDGPSCRPGGGGASLFGLQKDAAGAEQRVQVKRDLAAEAEAMKNAAAACPALKEGEQISESRWQLENAENCLELLLQFQALGDALVVEWPRGGSMKVRAELTPQSMLGAIQSSGQDWFALSGTVMVDSNLTFSVRQLLNLLRERRSRFIPVGEGQFVALTREFQRRLEILDSLADGRTKDLRVSPLAASALEGVFEPGALVGDEKWRALCARVKEAQKLNPEVPRTLKAELRPYQEEGFKWLARLAHWGGGACLADEMGLGKTLQALALLLQRAPSGPALVVAPTSVCGNWADEAARFAPTLNLIDYRTAERGEVLKSLEPMDVVLASYGLLQSAAADFAGVQWRTVVLDEAQAVKNMVTKRSAAVMDLSGDFRMIMTGTPLENHLGELWNLFRFLNPGLLGSLEGFQRRFASPIAEGDADARSRLKRVIQPFLLRRLKEQVLEELPPRTEVTLRVDLSPEERAFYEALRQNAVEEIAAAGEGAGGDRRFAIFAQLMKLRRCCCSVSLVSKDLGAGIPSSKLEAFLSLTADLREGGHRVLVFSQFVDHLQILREALDAQGVTYQYLDGSTAPQARRARVQAFQAGEGDCFLISLKAGGTGLNLTGADYVIHMDPWWNPAVEDQASDRAHRMGQTRPVTIDRIVARNTVEEKIVELHSAKRRLAQDLLENSAYPAALDPRELLELIREP